MCYDFLWYRGEGREGGEEINFVLMGLILFLGVCDNIITART